MPRRATLDDASSPAEGAERGRAARSEVPRSSHGDWEPAPDRPDPIALLAEQARTRVPELVPLRHGRMAASTFAFFRGAALPMAADLAATPGTGINVQACGDAHLSNLGGFAAPDRRLVFDLNDFDETLPGPWEWDVKRLAASLAIAARARGFRVAERRAIVSGAVRAYRTAMREFAAQPTIDVWHTRLDQKAFLRRVKELGAASDVDRAQRRIDKAHQKDARRAVRKLTEVVDGERRFISDPPIIVPVDELVTAAEAERMRAANGELLAAYRRSLPPDAAWLLGQYRPVHLARKVVGVGSVGTRCWVVLMLGRDDDDPLVLQIKEAEASVLERFVGASAYRHHGRRVVEGQRLTQAAGDPVLGWVRATGVDGVERDFYIRQLWDWKVSAAVETMSTDALAFYGRLCGWTLARSHARSGDRYAIGAYLGSGDRFDKAIARFAERYADQSDRDHRALLDAIDAGRLPAERED